MLSKGDVILWVNKSWLLTWDELFPSNCCKAQWYLYFTFMCQEVGKSKFSTGGTGSPKMIPGAAGDLRSSVSTTQFINSYLDPKLSSFSKAALLPFLFKPKSSPPWAKVVWYPSRSKSMSSPLPAIWPCVFSEHQNLLLNSFLTRQWHKDV